MSSQYNGFVATSQKEVELFASIHILQCMCLSFRDAEEKAVTP